MNSEAVERLWQWFGSRQFLVAHLNDEQVQEIANLLGIQPPELRSKVGRRLSNRTLWSDTGNSSLRLAVVSRANGSVAAVYQVQDN